MLFFETLISQINFLPFRRHSLVSACIYISWTWHPKLRRLKTAVCCCSRNERFVKIREHRYWTNNTLRSEFSARLYVSMEIFCSPADVTKDFLDCNRRIHNWIEYFLAHRVQLFIILKKPHSIFMSHVPQAMHLERIIIIQFFNVLVWLPIWLHTCSHFDNFNYFILHRLLLYSIFKSAYQQTKLRIKITSSLRKRNRLTEIFFLGLHLPSSVIEFYILGRHIFFIVMPLSSTVTTLRVERAPLVKVSSMKWHVDWWKPALLIGAPSGNK